MFFVNERTRKLHLDFEDSMIDKYISFWESVIFVNELKFNIFTSGGRITVWKKAQRKSQFEKSILTVKHGNGGIIVWGCFVTSGMENLVFIESIMN